MTTLKTLKDTKEFASNFANQLVGGEGNIILLFYGEMGSGKTTFIKALGKALGVKEKITSPTFLGLNEYYSGNVPLYHFDLYQVPLSHEDFSELCQEDETKVLAIEWAEKLDEHFVAELEQSSNSQTYSIEIEVNGKDRELEIKHSG